MKPIGYIACIVLITVIFFLIVVLVELPWLSANLPQLPEGITKEQWETSFSSWALGGVCLAGSASLLWYILAQWSFKINHPEDAKGKGITWGVFFLITVIGAIATSVIFTMQVKIGGIAVHLLFVLNGAGCYYLSTLLFSPPVFKFIPWGAARIRPLFPW